MKRLTILLFFTVSLLLACKKNSDPGTSTSLVVGKWNMQPTVYEGYANGTLSTTNTQQYDATDYVEFKADGTMQSKSMGSIQTHQYSVKNDTLIFDNVRKSKINALTANTLSYTYIDYLSATYYTKSTFNLKR